MKFKHFLGKVKFNLSKHSPEILMVAGGISVVTGTVLACKKTLNLPDILDEHKTIADDIKSEHAYDESKDYKHDITKLYLSTIKKIAKNYAVPVVIEASGLFMFFSSNKKLRKRNAEIMAAYVTLNNAFKFYRKNVVETFGEDIDNDMLFGTKRKDIEVTDEEGKTKKIKNVKVFKESSEDFDNLVLTYRNCKGFTEGNTKNAIEYNVSFMKFKINEILRIIEWNHYTFIDKFYELMGIEVTKASRVCGWFSDPSKYGLPEIKPEDIIKFEVGCVEEVNEFTGEITEIPALAVSIQHHGIIYDIIEDPASKLKNLKFVEDKPKFVEV